MTTLQTADRPSTARTAEPRAFTPQEEAIFAEFGLGPKDPPVIEPPPAQTPSEREASRLSRVLINAAVPDLDTIRLCDIANATVRELRELLHTDRADRVIEDTSRIVHRRLEIVRAEAEIAAWSRLLELAASTPFNARERETARKAAAQILRELAKPRAAPEPARDQPRPPADPDPDRSPDPSPGRRPARPSPPARDTHGVAPVTHATDPDAAHAIAHTRPTQSQRVSISRGVTATQAIRAAAGAAAPCPQHAIPHRPTPLRRARPPPYPPPCSSSSTSTEP